MKLRIIANLFFDIQLPLARWGPILQTHLLIYLSELLERI